MGECSVEIFGGPRVEGLRLKCGTEIDADVLVVAAGITPNAELAQSAGLRCDRGIVVSDLMLTSDPSVYALGECCEHRGVCYGLVAPLYEQDEQSSPRAIPVGFKEVTAAKKPAKSASSQLWASYKEARKKRNPAHTSAISKVPSGM